MSIENDLISIVLKEDKHKISYRPSWKAVTKSVNATILLQQVRFRWFNKGGEPFYKFIQPPKAEHVQYKENDSWIEELGFTLSEYQGAFKKIGKRLKKSELDHWQEALDGYFMGCFTDQNHMTWFYFNESYFTKRIVEHYKILNNSPNRNSLNRKFPNGRIGNSQTAESEIPKRIYTETTTETTTKKEKESSSNFSDPLTHIVSYAKSHQPGQEALSEPADYDKFWSTRDEALTLYNQKMGRSPGQLKNQYMQFVQEHVTGGDDLKALAASFDAALLNWAGSGSPPLARIFEIYRHGRGDYEKFRSWKWPEAPTVEGTSGLARSDDERTRIKQKLAERNGGHGKTNEH